MPDSHTIAENLTRLQTARTNIATAITTKGGTVASGAGLEDFPTAIGTIPAGGGGDIGALIDGSITSCNIPSGTTKIKQYAFLRCASLTSVTIPSSVTSIEQNAFNNCTALSAVTIPTGVISLGNACFGGCTSITSITISSTVTRIEPYAFYNCSKLQTLTFEGSIPPAIEAGNAFNGIPTSVTIRVPTGSLTAYTTANNYPDPNRYIYVEY